MLWIRRSTRTAAACLIAATTVVPTTRALAQSEGDSTQRPGELTVGSFENLTGEASDAWIGVGIAESLAADLGATAVGNTAGARWHVQGAYQHWGTRLRIAADLVDRSIGEIVGAARVDGDMSDLFALEDELADRLTRAMRLAQRASKILADEGDGASESDVRGSVDTPTARSPRSTGPDTFDPAPSGVTGGTSGFSITGTTIIDGPPPPVPPAVASRDAQGRMTLRAIHLDTPLRLDGQLDERIYQTVPPVTDFVQQEPNEGAPATERTEVWVMFDEERVYVSFRSWESEPTRMIANEMRRDNSGVFRNDNVAFILDTFYDRRNGVEFLVNPIGGRMDGQITDERLYNGDWNPIWDVEVGRFEGGWTAEASIPFKSLRYRRGATQVWGFNARRVNAWKNEHSFLMGVPSALGGAGIFQLSRAATLVGLEVPTGSKNLDLKPYAITDLASDNTITPQVVNELGGDIGLDVKYGMTDNLVGDVTINTDFAQVEADEQQVNLTRFSLFFPEKREFFLENQGTFAFGGVRSVRAGGGGVDVPVLFYSREIGLDGGRQVPMDIGGRLTGRVGRFTVGAMNIQTGDVPEIGTRSTNFTVARIRRDILRRSNVGVLFTGRSVSRSGAGSSETYGVDGIFSFYDNLNVNTYWAKTNVPGLRGDDVSYRAQLDYNGDRYGVQAEQLVVGGDFRPEVGFIRRDDFDRRFGLFRFSPRPERLDAVRKLTFEGQIAYVMDRRGLLETRENQGRFGIEFQNSDSFDLTYTDSYELLTEPFQIAPDVAVPVGGYSFQDTQASLGFGQQRAISGTVSLQYGSFFGGNKTTVGVSRGRLELTPLLSVEPSVSYNRVDLPEGRFTTNLVSARTTYTMTPLMFVSALLQYNSSAEALSTNLRLRWEYQPGSELFVVYNEQRDTLTPRFPELENRSVVVKINRLFRF